MYRFFAVILLLIIAGHASGQKLDSIFFNLYTDSLKRGTYNYINVDGKFHDGTYLPLGEKELKFTASAGRFRGNSLYVDSAFAGEKIRVKVVLIKNPRISKEVDIYIKQHEEEELLPTMEEVMNGTRRDSTGKKKRKRK